ncbi:MAG TPA: hypothetical protein VHY30_03285 [Verrucomicrobiae bacterium]|jgi:hypothetical protein|nr:hypothetical protein [Verrucomicrobiae bacterium]
MKCERQFQKFCQKHIYGEFVLFGIGLSIPLVSKYLPASFENWIYGFGSCIAVLAAIVLAIGLITAERERRQK